jgi:hypothetical protein
MKKGRNSITALLLAAVICLGLGACGTGGDGVLVDGGVNPSQPTNLSVKTVTIATDSWGSIGSIPILISIPGKTEILIKKDTTLVDAHNAVVSGETSTKISFSPDIANLSRSAQASPPGNLVSYVDIAMGLAKSAIPELSVTVDVSPVAPDQKLTVYNYDADIGKWISAQPVVVSSSGTITFQADKLSLWAVFQ